MALLAALLGGFFIYQQITASSVLERERLRRQLEAGRAALPFLLSALLEYLESCTAILLQTQNTQSRTPQQTILPVQIPDVIVPLLRLIETGDATVADALASLLAQLQVYDARMSGIIKQQRNGMAGTTRFELIRRVAETGALYVEIEQLLPYARRQNDVLERRWMTPDDVLHGCRHLLMFQDIDGLTDYVNSHYLWPPVSRK